MNAAVLWTTMRGLERDWGIVAMIGIYAAGCLVGNLGGRCWLSCWGFVKADDRTMNITVPPPPPASAAFLQNIVSIGASSGLMALFGALISDTTINYAVMTRVGGGVNHIELLMTIVLYSSPNRKGAKAACHPHHHRRYLLCVRLSAVHWQHGPWRRHAWGDGCSVPASPHVQS